ncbi:MAG TPA: WD40 repeat domain-containing protein [Planctomycetota bacterium]|nr:WD40 repeat domain-containing protein [Planctomycetota bacterium]
MRRAAPALLLAIAAGCSFRSPLIPPEPRAVLDTLVPELRALAFSPDGLLLASAGGEESGGDEIALWIVATGLRRSTFAHRTGTISAMAFSPDSASLAVGEGDGRIRILDARTGEEQVAFSGRPGRVTCLAYSFDGKALITMVEGDPEAEVRRWDVKTGESRDLFTPPAAPPVALAPDGSRLALPSPGDPAGIRVVDLETRHEHVLSRIGLLQGDALIFTPDSKDVAAVHLEEWSPLPNHVPYLYLLNAETGKILLRSPRPFGSRRALAVSHDAKLLAHGVGQGLQLWELGRKEVRTTLEEIPDGEAIELLVFSPDDKTLVSADTRGRILLWDVPRLLELRREPSVK